jgi:D-3-phosphoglycerate dehydrogenase
MFHYYCLNPIASFGLDYFNKDYEEAEELAQADAVLVRSAAMHDMELPEKLCAVARAGAGVNNIPLEKCSEQGIVVFNTPGANANGVKELVLAGLLLASRDIIGGVNWVQSERMNEEIAKESEKQKKQFAGREILGKKLGIIGLGAIGVQVANAATHLGMEVLGYDPYISVEAAWNLSRSIRHITNVDDIYRECDYITIHVPLLDSTRQMINAAAISRMKEGVVVLNFARDLLVDEKDMVSALREGKVKRYVTDFPNPTTAGARGTIVIPHLGASTTEAEENCARAAVKEIRCYLEHGNIKNSVNFPDCDMGIPAYPCRIAIAHRNIKNMLKQFAAIMSSEDHNIGNMLSLIHI